MSLTTYASLVLFALVAIGTCNSWADSGHTGRLVENEGHGCGEQTDVLLEEFNHMFANAPGSIKTISTGIKVDVCNWPEINASPLSYAVSPEAQSVEAVLTIISSRSAKFWIYAFNNDVNITEEVFSGHNLLDAKRNQATSLKIPIKLTGQKAQIISIFAMEALETAIDSESGHITSARVAIYTGNIENSFDFKYVKASEGSFNPYPERLSLAADIGAEESRREIVFATKTDQSQLSFIPIDVTTGQISEADCGTGKNRIVNVMLESWNSVSVFCNLLGPIDSLVIVTLPDYFTPTDENGTIHYQNLDTVSAFQNYH